MDSLSTPCIFCGTDRPIESEICPTCGRGWIDEHLPQPAPPPAASAPEATDTPAASAAVPAAPPARDEESDAASTEQDGDSPAGDQPDAAGVSTPAVAAAAAGAGLAFSDSADTGDDVATADEAGQALLAEEPVPAAELDSPVDEATSMFSAGAIAEPAQPATTAAEPPPPDEIATQEPAAAGTPTSETTSSEAAESEPAETGDHPETSGALDMAPVDPDELGIIPVVQAQGPPEYLPEPAETPPPTEPPAGAATPTGAPPAEDDLPEFITPEPAAHAEVADSPPSEPDTGDAEQLGVIPVVKPAVGDAADPFAPAGDAQADAGPEPEQPTPDVPAAPPEPPQQTAAAAAAPSADGAIDPDGLINDVFAEDLVDGRPPLASDDMLDDDSAWAEFALGGAAAASTGAAAPPPTDTSAPTPPSESPPPRQPTAEQPAPPPTIPAAAVPAAAAAASSVGGEFGGQHPDESDFFATPVAADTGQSAGPAGDKPPSRSRWSQTAIVVAIVLGIVAAWFVVLAVITRDTGDEDPAVAADPDTTAPASTAAPETTLAPTTTAAPSTTQPPTTTVPTIEPVGDPIPLEELQLGAFALGPIEFGATDGLGRLVASLDQPDALADAGVDQGLCPDDTGFTADWGPLSAIFIGSTETNLLVGYQLGNDPTHPTSELTTLSGIKVGDSVGDLEATYASFEISYEEIDDQLHFILVRQSDAATLLWGPVSSSEAEGIVEGIYSPRDCDKGPAPSA